MRRVARALAWHELLERTRDRWVLVISALFALLAMGIGLYGRGLGEDAAGALTGPSLVTLAGLFVPLVALILGHDAVVGERERNTLGLLFSLPVTKAEVVLAKFSGRLVALVCAVTIGLSAALLINQQGGRFLLAMTGQTLLLGAAFLSIGILISTLFQRQVTAVSVVVCVWFLLVFFYDLSLLGLLVISDGALSQELVGGLVLSNPAGLFRVQMLAWFAGEEVLANLGLGVGLPGELIAGLIWTGWICLPLLASILLLNRARS